MRAGARRGSCGAMTDAPPTIHATARWLAAWHDRPWSDAAVSARLPAGGDPDDPGTMARALAAAGLRARLVQRRLRALDPEVLPCVVFPRSGPPRILLSLSLDGRRAVVADPSRGGVEEEVPLRKLGRGLRRDVLFVTPAEGPGADRFAPAEGPGPRHWFWGPMRENAGGWLQIAIAALAVNLLGLALPLFVMNVYDRVIPNLAFVTLWTLAVGVGIAIALDLVLRALRGQTLESIGRRLDTGIAASLFAHALSLRPGGQRASPSVLVSQIRDFETVREFFGSASFVSLIDLLFVGLFIWVLWIIVGPLAFVPLLAVPLVMLLAFVAQLPMARIAGEAQALAGRRQTVLTEALTGHETIKTLGAEPVMQREWERASAASARINGRSRFWSSVTTSGTQMLQQGVSVTIIVWGVFLVAEGRITVGALIGANILAGRAMAPLGAIAHTIFRARYAMTALSTLSQFMRTPPEAGPHVLSAARVKAGDLHLADLTYRYPGAPRDAVSHIHLSVKPGECVALLGRVGSGKSTVGKLISGLLAPDAGQVLIDGRGAGQYDPAELRRGVGYLPQEPELFTGTLRENLVIGHPGATPEEIDAALEDAALRDFVEADPEGLQRFIGQTGTHLSGGQRQALALARLLLRRPKLMFLDEPTNAMDREMEAAVAARLKALSEAGTGMILCTHRPGLAEIADRWIVMEGGRILLDDAPARVIARLSAQGGQGAEPRGGFSGPQAAE